MSRARLPLVRRNARGLSRYRALPSMRCPAAHGFMRERGDLGLGPLQPVGPVEGCELTVLIRVHDLGWAEFVDRLVQRLEAELGLPLTGRCLHANTERGRVRYPPGQHLAGKPVHALRRLKEIAYRPKDRHQIQEAFAHRQICDVGAPDLIGPINAQPAQQIGVRNDAPRNCALRRLGSVTRTGSRSRRSTMKPGG